MLTAAGQTLPPRRTTRKRLKVLKGVSNRSLSLRPLNCGSRYITLRLHILVLRPMVVLQMNRHVRCSTVVPKLLRTQFAKDGGSLFLILFNEFPISRWNPKYSHTAILPFSRGRSAHAVDCLDPPQLSKRNRPRGFCACALRSSYRTL